MVPDKTMALVVMMMLVAVVAATNLKLFRAHHAAFQLTATNMLKLNGGVADLEVLAQNMVDALKDDGTLRGGDIGNGDMRGQSPGA